MFKLFFALLFTLCVIRNCFGARIKRDNSESFSEILRGAHPTTIPPIASNTSIDRDNETFTLPDDVWPAVSILRTYKVYNSPRGVYISSMIHGVERASRITGMNEQTTMLAFDCKTRFFLSGVDGRFYSVNHGETMAVQIEGLPGFSDYKEINHETCEVVFRHYQLTFFISRNGGDEKCKVEVAKIPQDCWNSDKCKKFMGMKEIKFKLGPGALKATQILEDQKENNSKPEGCP